MEPQISFNSTISDDDDNANDLGIDGVGGSRSRINSSNDDQQQQQKDLKEANTVTFTGTLRPYAM